MPKIDVACDTCHPEIDQVFDPDSGTRPLEVITGDRFVTDCCFVADEIRFLGDGRLIFRPEPEQHEYCHEYFVICRKLVVEGGHSPAGLNPCGPDDPGHSYRNNNAITWEDRLSPAGTGPDQSPPKANDGDSYDRNAWSDAGQGNNGRNGGDGENGSENGDSDNTRSNGRDAPNFTLVALDVNIGFGDHLTIDFDGQNGGTGGRGQDGGDGGDGEGGRNGESDTSWPGIGCDRQPGNGGDGGNGGMGGVGGNGGRGGSGGDITIISTAANISGIGPFVSGSIHYVNDGGDGGSGGLGGFGGKGGKGGRPGFKSRECDEAHSGDEGDNGFPWPPVGPGSNDNKGVTGSNGGGGGLNFEEVTEDTCADMIPLVLKIDSGPVPAIYCRGFDSAGIGEGTVTGENLSQVTSVEVGGLANVTVMIMPSSDDAHLDLRFTLASDSGVGTGDLIFHSDFGPSETLSGAIEVRRFEAFNVSPNSGARGSTVNVTITGACFDPSASLQQVNVSGVGVNVDNIVILDSETITCNFEIGNLAAANSRDVTVRNDLRQHTLVGGFTVTS